LEATIDRVRQWEKSIEEMSTKEDVTKLVTDLNAGWIGKN
jgi:hypothetical protein